MKHSISAMDDKSEMDQIHDISWPVDAEFVSS